MLTCDYCRKATNDDVHRLVIDIREPLAQEDRVFREKLPIRADICTKCLGLFYDRLAELVPSMY